MKLLRLKEIRMVSASTILLCMLSLVNISPAIAESSRIYSIKNSKAFSCIRNYRKLEYRGVVDSRDIGSFKVINPLGLTVAEGTFNFRRTDNKLTLILKKVNYEISTQDIFWKHTNHVIGDCNTRKN